MAYWIKHKFQTAKADGTDVTLVKPTNWNDEHEVWMEEGTVIGRPPGSGSGPGESIPITSLMPAGMVMPYAGSAAPAGWLFCQGQSLLRADYPNLFAIIGSGYGAVDAAHFSLPDLRGRSITGVDAGAGRIGTAVGGVLGSFGGQEMVQYYADVSVGGTMYGYATGSLSVRVAMSTQGASSFLYGIDTSGGSMAAQEHSHWMDGTFGTSGNLRSYVNEGSMSGGGYTRNASNMPPTIVLHYVIKT